MANASCYKVYDKDGSLVYRGSNTPIDLAWPHKDLHDNLAPLFPDGHMVFQPNYECEDLPKKEPVGELLSPEKNNAERRFDLGENREQVMAGIGARSGSRIGNKVETANYDLRNLLLGK